MPEFNTLDYILLGLLAVGLIRGTVRGLSGELAGLLGLLIAGFAAWHFYAPLGDMLAETTQLEPIQSDTVAVVVLVIGAMILLYAASMLLKQVMELTFKGGVERLGGALAGLIRYAVILAALLLVVAQFAQGTAQQLIREDSVIASRSLEILVPWYEEVLLRYVDETGLLPEGYLRPIPPVTEELTPDETPYYPDY